MEDLTFGEQVKIILGRKGMTIKELAETIEKETGKKMSRQNLTQRLGRDRHLIKNDPRAHPRNRFLTSRIDIQQDQLIQ